MPTRRLTRLKSATLDDEGREVRSFQGASSIHYLKLIEDQGEVGFWTKDFVTDTGTCSAGVYRMLSIESGADIDLLQIIHPDDRERLEMFEAGLVHGSPMNIMFRIIRPDGAVRRINYRAEALFDGRGSPIRAIGILRDVTEIHELQRIIECTRTHNRKLLSLMGASEWGIDVNGRLVFRQEWAKLTGQDLSDASGWGWLEMLHPDSREAAKLQWKDALACQSTFDLKTKIRCEDGCYREFHIIADPMVQAERTLTEWAGVVRPLLVSDASYMDPDSTTNRLSSRQIRVARSLLEWTHEDLAEKANISVSSVRRAEVGGLPMRSSTYAAISKTFFAYGIRFGTHDRKATSVTILHGDERASL